LIRTANHTKVVLLKFESKDAAGDVEPSRIESGNIGVIIGIRNAVALDAVVVLLLAGQLLGKGHTPETAEM